LGRFDERSATSSIQAVGAQRGGGQRQSGMGVADRAAARGWLTSWAIEA